MKNKEKLKKLHYILVELIKKYGDSFPKENGHGLNYTATFSNGWEIYLDSYNNSIRLKDAYTTHINKYIDNMYLGMDFGGFETNVNEKTYKYILGTIAKTFWRSRRPI